MENLNQQNLFGESTYPEGFSYASNFISPKEEEFLLQKIKTLELGHLVIQGVPSKRRMIHFGVGYSFETKKLTDRIPIPDWLNPLIENVSKFTKKPPNNFEEILVTEYQPGAGITWHKDADPFGIIVGVSLAGSSTLKLRKIDNAKIIKTLVLEPRSAYLLSGESRTQWAHSIPAVKNLRYSVTFRTLK
ncbi:MAG TPA: alpha-ketoglutarate-dependent dioxygenase AlkB [Verrucomicrobiae bacterium]|nr:alpha-ketoglutarate-dependent dioxygenase AlkB [Verrucomicrobiae bacterium]